MAATDAYRVSRVEGSESYAVFRETTLTEHKLSSLLLDLDELTKPDSGHDATDEHAASVIAHMLFYHLGATQEQVSGDGLSERIKTYAGR